MYSHSSSNRNESQSQQEVSQDDVLEEAKNASTQALPQSVTQEASPEATTAGSRSRTVAAAMEGDRNASRDVLEHADADARNRVDAGHRTHARASQPRTRTSNAPIGISQTQHSKTHPSINGAPTALSSSPFANQRNTHPSDSSNTAQRGEDEREIDHIGKLISSNNATIPVAQRITAPEIEIFGDDELNILGQHSRQTAQSAKLNGSISDMSDSRTPANSLKAYYNSQPKDVQYRNSIPLVSSNNSTNNSRSRLENNRTQAQTITPSKQLSGNVQVPISAPEQTSATITHTSNVVGKPVSSVEERFMSVGPKPQLPPRLDDDPPHSVTTKHMDAATSNQSTSTYSNHKAAPVQSRNDQAVEPAETNKSSVDPQRPVLSLNTSSSRSTVSSQNVLKTSLIPIPYSSVWDSDPLSPLSDDGLTSADAEGDLEVEILLSELDYVQSITQARRNASLSHNPPPLIPRSTSTGSPFLSTAYTPAKKKRRLLDYVEIPPLPAGKREDYRPMRPLRETHKESRRTKPSLRQKDDQSLDEVLNRSIVNNARLTNGPLDTRKRKGDHAEKILKERKRAKTAEKDIFVSKLSTANTTTCPSPVPTSDPRSRPRSSHPDSGKSAPSKNHTYNLFRQSRNISHAPRPLGAPPLRRSSSMVSKRAGDEDISVNRKSILESDESDSDGWAIDIHDVSHDKPRVVWFHTRFIRDTLGSSGATMSWDWTALENVTEECKGGQGLKVKVKLLNSDLGEEREYHCGGALKWEECPPGKVYHGRKNERLGGEMSVQGHGTDSNNDDELETVARYTTPVPKSNPNKLVVSKQAVKQSHDKGERRIEKDVPQSSRSPALKSRCLPSLSSDLPQSSQQNEVMHSKDRKHIPSPSSEPLSRSRMSEKALGKQKESEAKSPLTRSAPSSIMPFPTSPILPSVVNDEMFRSPVQADTHGILDASMEQYLDFSPDKDKSQMHGSIVASPSVKSPMGYIGGSLHWNDAQPDLYLSQQHESPPSAFHEFGIDTLPLDQFHDSLRSPLNGEGRDLPLTINPSLLSHNPVHGPTTRFDLELDEQGPNPDSNIDLGHGLLPSPEHSASLVNPEPSLDVRSDPGEFSDDSIPLASLFVRRNSHSPSFDRTEDKERELSSSVAVSSTLARTSDEEENSGQEAPSDVDSDYRGSSESEGHANIRNKRPSAGRQKRRLRPEAKSQTQTQPRRPIKSFAGTSRDQGQWECGKIIDACHQCRGRTKKLKMECRCGKKYCNRCVALRYPGLSFRLQLDSHDCPYCRNECNCDKCCQKRGEVYVTMHGTLRDYSIKETPEAGETSPLLPRLTRRSTATHRNLPLPSPEPIAHIPGPYHFWANVYDMDGLKIAEAYSGSQRPEKGVFVKAVEGYQRPVFPQIYIPEQPNPSSGGKREKPAKRIFVGCCQPSWNLSPDPYIQELESTRPKLKLKKRKPRGSLTAKETRWVIGREDLLYCPVITCSKDLPLLYPSSDLSSLSSLSDDSDIEVEPASPVRRDVKVHVTVPEIQKDATSIPSDFNPTAVETTDIVRMLTLTLNKCGFSAVTIDKTLPNA